MKWGTGLALRVEREGRPDRPLDGDERPNNAKTGRVKYLPVPKDKDSGVRPYHYSLKDGRCSARAPIRIASCFSFKGGYGMGKNSCQMRTASRMMIATTATPNH